MLEVTKAVIKAIIVIRTATATVTARENVRADLARNNILRRKRKECMLPRYLVCENCGDEDGGTN